MLELVDDRWLGIQITTGAASIQFVIPQFDRDGLNAMSDSE
ncbi:MAG: hypothetical protein P8N76_01425 [Pirellulaceae bacterium]|nr:hypothetical protein [Pirellulaceae bacterium]